MKPVLLRKAWPLGSCAPCRAEVQTCRQPELGKCQNRSLPSLARCENVVSRDMKLGKNAKIRGQQAEKNAVNQSLRFSKTVEHLDFQFA